MTPHHFFAKKVGVDKFSPFVILTVRWIELQQIKNSAKKNAEKIGGEKKKINTKIILIILGGIVAALLLAGTVNAAGYADDVCVEDGEMVNRNPFMGSVERQCCPGLVENRISRTCSVCEKPAPGTTIHLGAQKVPETIIIKNEIEMSKVIIMLVDRDAYDNRKTVLAPADILGCEMQDLEGINSVAATVPTTLLEFLDSSGIKKIVPDAPVMLPKPPVKYPVRYPIYPK